MRKLWVIETRCCDSSGLPYAAVESVSATIGRDAEITNLRCSHRRSKVRITRLLRRTKCTVRHTATLIRYFRKGDTVLAVSNPLEAPIWIAITALFRGGSYLYFWTAGQGTSTEGIDRGRVTDDAERRQYFRRWALKHVAGIIVDSRELATLAAERTEGLDTPIHLLAFCPGNVEFSDC